MSTHAPRQGRVIIELAGWKSLHVAEHRRALATIFAAQSALRPDRWWAWDGERAFDVEAFALAEVSFGPRVVGLRSGPPVVLESAFSLVQPWLEVNADLAAVEEMGFEPWLALADALAVAFEADYGRVAVLVSPELGEPGVDDRVRERRYSLALEEPRIKHYAGQAAKALGPCLYLGPRLRAAFADEVAAWPGPGHDLGGGLRRLDVAPNPLGLGDLEWLEGRERLTRHFARLWAARPDELDCGGRARDGGWDGTLRDDPPPWDFVESRTFGPELVRLAGEGATVSSRSFAEVQLPGADLRGLIARDVDFEYALLDDACLDGVDLEGCDFKWLGAANASFVGARLHHGCGQGMIGEAASFQRVSFAHVDLSAADLSRASFVEATLIDVNLTEATLAGASFTGATLRQVRFTDADLRGADLCGVHLDGGSLERADLRGARLDGLVLTEVCVDGVKLDPGVVLAVTT